MQDIITLVMIIVYFIICIYLGYSAGKKEKTEDFLIADRKVGTFKLTASIVAGFVGANFLMVNSAFVFVYGISTAWVFVGMFIGFIIFSKFGLFLKDKADKNKYYTLSDYFKDTSGKYVAVIATISVLLIYFGTIITQFIGGSKMLEQISGWPYEISLIIIILVVVIYLLLGGFKSVIKTDVFQFLLMIIIPVLLVFAISSGINLPPEYFDIFNIGFVTIFAFLLYGIFINFVYAELWQRIYAGKDKKTVKKSVILSGIVVFVIGAIITYVSLITRSVFESIDSDLAAYYGFTHLIPPVFLGVSLLFIFAVLMSSIDTSLFVLASSFAHDIMNHKRNLSAEKIKKYIKIGIIVFSIFGAIIALIYPRMIDLVIAYTAIASTLAPFILISWKSKLNVKAAIFSYSFTVVTILVLIFGFGILHPGLGLVSIILTFIVYYIATLFFRN